MAGLPVHAVGSLAQLGRVVEGAFGLKTSLQMTRTMLHQLHDDSRRGKFGLTWLDLS